MTNTVVLIYPKLMYDINPITLDYCVNNNLFALQFNYEQYLCINVVFLSFCVESGTEDNGIIDKGYCGLRGKVLSISACKSCR